MRVYVADETALVKEVSADTGSIVQQWGEQSRPDAVTAMCFGGADEREVFLGRKNGTLSVVRDGELVDLVEGCSEQFCGLSVHEDTIVTCAQDGVVRYRSLNALEEGEEEADFHTVKAHQNVKRMRVSKEEPSIFAVGGDEADLRIWDVNRPEKPVFKAKNVKNDMLNMRVPVDISDLAFVPETGHAQVITASKHRVLRRYDSRVKGRPVMQGELGEFALTTMDMTPDARHLVVGDTVGNVHMVDVQSLRSMGTFRGFAGSVRSVQCHRSEPFVAAVGLDRFLRVYSTTTRRLHKKVYLKQSLNACLFSIEPPIEEPKKEEKDAADGVAADGEEDESLWTSMDVAQGKASDPPAAGEKRKQKADNPTSHKAKKR